MTSVTLRDGSGATLLGRGILGGILVGEHNGAPISWHPRGSWRWDDQDDPRDIVEGLPLKLDRHAVRTS